MYSNQSMKKSTSDRGFFRWFNYFRPRVFSWIFPSLSIESYFTLFPSLMSFRLRWTSGDFSRAKYRCLRSLFRIPEPCTRFVKRRIRFAVLSWLFFFTSTFVAICGQRIPWVRRVCKQIFESARYHKQRAGHDIAQLQEPPCSYLFACIDHLKNLRDTIAFRPVYTLHVPN